MLWPTGVGILDHQRLRRPQDGQTCGSKRQFLLSIYDVAAWPILHIRERPARLALLVRSKITPLVRPPLVVDQQRFVGELVLAAHFRFLGGLDRSGSASLAVIDDAAGERAPSAPRQLETPGRQAERQVRTVRRAKCAEREHVFCSPAQPRAVARPGVWLAGGLAGAAMAGGADSVASSHVNVGDVSWAAGRRRALAPTTDHEGQRRRRTSDGIIKNPAALDHSLDHREQLHCTFLLRGTAVDRVGLRVSAAGGAGLTIGFIDVRSSMKAVEVQQQIDHAFDAAQLVP